MSERLDLTLAVGDYDHVRDLVSGRVGVEGVRLRALVLAVEEIFFRFTRFREWHASELSLARYVALRGSGDESLTAIPVFPSRVLRHSAFYVRRGAGIKALADLRGARVGVPEWAQTATVWARGLLSEEHGIPLQEVRWIQAGVNEPGRAEGVPLELPPGVLVSRGGDRSLNDLLVAGDLDAIISARPPRDFRPPDGPIVRLLDEPLAAEAEYLRRTGVFPIMHVIALRADVHAAYPWVAANLLAAFEAAKRRSLERLADVTCSHIPLPWVPQRAAEAIDLVGGDGWPYGVEHNGATLEAFLRLAHDQGVSARRLSVEDLFAPETLAAHRV